MLGAKPRLAQLATWKFSEGLSDGAFCAEDLRRYGERVAVGRVERKAGAVDVEKDRAQAEGDALKDLGERIGDRGDLGGFGIDAQGGTDDDVAEVIATGDRRSDDREAERRAVVGAGEIGLTGQKERVGAGPNSGARFADQA